MTTLLADIGGTNARFAVLAGGMIGPVVHLLARDYARFADALAAGLERQADPAKITAAILAVAGAINDNRCALTNSPWIIDAAELRDAFGLKSVDLVNDFAALAWSLPALPREALRILPGGHARAGEPMVVLGPGTGFGVAAYVPHGGSGLVLTTEAGHVGLAGSSPREDAVIGVLREEFGRVSSERILSGPGFENLYRALCRLDGITLPERSAAEITRDGLSGSCTICRAALDMFCAFLGSVAGDLALSYGARGGVFVAGGITAHLADYLPVSQFRARFEDKGRMRKLTEQIPVSLITGDDTAFIGLKVLAEHGIAPK